MQEWWAGSTRRDRRRHDRVRDGDRQGGRPLRLPLQPAEGPRVATRRRSAEPDATASESICELFACPRRRAHARELRLRRHADAGSARRAARRDVLEHPTGAEFAVSEYELSVRHDLRPLVLKTALTYLELDGVLRQGTPFYAGYRLRPTGSSLDDVFGRFDESRAGFLRRWSRAARPAARGRPSRPTRGRVALGEEREPDRGRTRVPRPAGLVELQPAELRQRYTLLARPARRTSSSSGCSSASHAASARRPSGSRTSSRSSPTTAARCTRSSATSARRAPSRAGTAAICLTARRSSFRRPGRRSRSSESSDGARSRRCARAIRTRSGRRDSVARFLSGITSPATTRAKLTRDPLFGALAERRFADVLAWCESASR